MNQDVELNDQKVKVAPPEDKVDFDFITAINDRQLGFTKKNVFSSSQINAAAEDELVKKQFKEMHCELPGVPRSTFLMEFSPDGTKVASTHGNHQIYVTDVRTGKHIKTLIGHPRTPWCIAFHPTSNQIIASGCLGGQVRIWDLSGGSEVWTVESQSVIASIAFHPDDRLLVIATFNELYFWDWCKPEPFMHVSTASAKEKVRYVAFDKLGHKLITGITNSPQTRWERVRSLPVPVSLPVSTERPMTGVRRRRLGPPRFNSSFRTTFPMTLPTPTVSTASNTSREPLSSVPERERRITSCYRELVNQYEVLVHRYLQIYRRPLMIDQGTDPMEIELNQASTSTQSNGQSQSTNRPSSPVPSTSGIQRRKSSALHPPKNRNRRMLYHSDSAGSSSSSSPVPDVSKANTTSGSTQTTSPIRCSTPQPGATHNQAMKSSSSSDEDNDDMNPNRLFAASKPDVAVKKFTKARQLNLTRTQPESSSSSTAAASTDTNDVEPKYKMRVKCFLTPKKAEVPAKRSAEASTSTVDPPAAGSSEADPDTFSANKINHLINNAKLILSKYRVTLQQRGLQGADLPEIPSTISGLPQGGPSSKPSKGTNTNEMESPPKRKRRLLRPNLLGNILFTSSDDSSSDNEPQSKMPCPAKSDNNATPVVESIASTSTETSTTANSPSNEHSYADVQSQSSTIKSSPPKRRKRLLTNRELCIMSEEGEADTPTHARPSTSAESPSGSHSENLLEVQRLVVESLSVLQQPTAAETAAAASSTAANDEERRLCGACGGCVEDTNPDTPPTDGCARTATVCTRLHSTRTSTSAVPPTTPPLDRARRRFLSHRLSAFHPTRMGFPRSRFTPVFPPLQYGMLGDRVNSSTETQSTTSNFAQDEVINYAERDAEETSSARNYHPFDPPPEVMSINPENIGIGSMYSNIVQELESSLNDVRNIRFRLGEMSDMLSNFSDRLENIMTQSNTILRNLSSSLEDLPANEGESTPQTAQSQRPTQGSPDTTPYSLEEIISPSPSWVRAYRSPYANNPISSDHTYPLNPEATQNATLSPLHLSLQLTVTHIQRQARLLRQQVESIERIDRAMIEVAQLQMIRQMFDELHIHFGANAGSDNRNGVSSVRQMMAGTRISDSSPYDSPSDEGSANTTPASTPANPSTNLEQPPATIQPSTSTSTSSTGTVPGATSSNLTEPTATNTQNTQTNRARTRKNYPRCLFLMHRQYRRTGNSTVNARRNAAKDRILLRRNIYRRFLPSRTNNRTTIDMSSLSMTRRLEHHLMEHSRYIGRSVIPVPPGSSTRTDVGEHVMALRLQNCRQRMNRLTGNFQNTTTSPNANVTSVTVDGTLRFAARQALGTTLDTITRFIEVNPTCNISSNFRSQIWEIIELSLLLSELLLLQIVDSIPPPSGMNLDPERENLSMRIDQMCTRMIQSRLMGQSNQLTRSLRLLRLTVRQATLVLGQTYRSRRNAMLPTNNGSERADTRQGLLDDIQNGLRNIMRMRNVREQLSGRSGDDSNFLGWYRTINDVISRYTSTGNSGNNGNNGDTGDNGDNDGATPSTSMQRPVTPSAMLNNETGEEIRPPAVTVEDANSSDENSNTDSSVPVMRPNRIGMYNFSRSQDDDSDELLHYRGLSYPNVPTVQVNDVPVLPVPDSHHSPWHPRSSEMLFRANRQRLNERLDELRTVGLFRPRFLHPLYSGVVNPFEDNLDETHRETIYDSDVIPTVTPNHRIQVWEFSQRVIPNINNAQKNLVVNECKIHNDASVDYASDGSILVTLLPSGGYMNVTNRLGVYSLEWETLGQCLYVTSFEQNAVSVSLSPTNRHLVVGLASRRVSILPTETWTMARIFLLDYRKTTHGNLSPIRELEQNRDTNYMSVNCIRWLPTSGQGLIFATNTGHLRLLT